MGGYVWHESPGLGEDFLRTCASEIPRNPDREEGKIVETRVESIIQELRSQLVALYGIRLRKIVLFGSQARGEAGGESDIDILVILDEIQDFWMESRRIKEITGPLSLDHDVVISALPMSENDYKERHTPFLHNVRREGVLV